VRRQLSPAYRKEGLLGKKVGDVAEITVLNGMLQFEILEIS
jgi:transcription elongation factor GreA